MTKIVRASAPSKIILTGEHSVVYGQPALVMAIDKKAFTKVERTKTITDPFIQITAQNYNTSVSIPFSTGPEFFKNQLVHLHPLLHIIQTIYIKEGLNDSLKIDIHSEVPKGADLGSSAAVCVSLSTALTSVFDLDYSLEDISNLSFKGEKIIHGTPSGVDNTVATFGGCMKFQQGNIKRVRSSAIQLIIGNTGISRETKKWVSKVRTRYESYPEVIDPTFEVMGSLTQEAEKFLANGDLEKLGEIFDINQGLLSTIGVSIPKLDHLINIAQTAGAYGAKLTGAGGGGCMFALVDKNNQHPVFRALQKNGIEPIIVNFESQGTKSEILSEIPSLNPQKSKKSGVAVLSSSFTRLTASSMIRSAIS